MCSIYSFSPKFSPPFPLNKFRVLICTPETGALWAPPLTWNYDLHGVSCVAKERIEAVDEEKKSITVKVVEGDVLQTYKEFKIGISVNVVDGEESLVTWTFDYEKRSDAVPDPTLMMDACLAMTKQIEHHRVLVPN